MLVGKESSVSHTLRLGGIMFFNIPWRETQKKSSFLTIIASFCARRIYFKCFEESDMYYKNTINTWV